VTTTDIARRPGGALVVAGTTLTPALFDDPKNIEDVLAKLEREVRAMPRDISTEEGRAAIASVAYKVARSKTALDDLGKNLVADWKARAELVDRERRKIRTRCDDLKDEFRAPLTQWEEAEKERVAAHEAALARVWELSVFGPEPTSDQVRARIVELGSLMGRHWQEFAQRAAASSRDTVAALERKLAERQKAEAEAAELERLRREDDERRQREREERIAAEAAARARVIAEETAAAAARAAAEFAEREQRRVERERQEAEDRAARAEQERQAAEERAARQAREAEEREARAREEAAAAERQRITDEQAAAAAEAERRENNKRIRARVNNVAAGDIVQAGGVSLDVAKAIVTAIAQGRVRHVSIEY